MGVLSILMASLCCGMLLSAQPAMNAGLARHLGSPFAATIVSLLVSIVLVLPFALAGAHRVRLDGIAATQWWMWIGGTAGAAVVTAGLVFAPRIGVTLFMLTVIAGQLLAAALIDQYGLLGMSVRSIDAPRVAGILLVVLGVVVFRFAGR